MNFNRDVLTNRGIKVRHNDVLNLTTRSKTAKRVPMRSFISTSTCLLNRKYPVDVVNCVRLSFQHNNFLPFNDMFVPLKFNGDQLINLTLAKLKKKPRKKYQMSIFEHKIVNIHYMLFLVCNNIFEQVISKNLILL